ncbi:hypothetical protein [Brevundimonas naejangsanensis]|uniref:hypothetical protein n=1 Tax=Brevundimonas naejangsanensis TaxID=588932 RepID=UPI0039F71DDC
MPQLAGAAAAWAVTAWTSAVTVVNTAMVAAAGAALPGLSFSAQLAVANFATKAVVFGGLAAASAALMRPNIPSSGTSLDFKPDPKAPVRGAMGYTALGGNKVFQSTWGYKKVAMSLGVALSLGPIDQVPRFEADGATVSFTGQQNEATGFYAADMWQRTTLGLPGDAALLPPTGLKYGNPGLTGWGTQHAAPQVSFSFWTMVLAKNPEDRDVYTNGVPDPRWIGRWMKVWQPRYDSTYPGGNGPQRRDDWRTWGWTENPYDHALAWVRGHYKLNLDGSIDRSKRVAGVGAPDSAIDIPAFVEGANIADANGWTISGEWSTGDGKFQTLLAMLQAGGGEPISRGAQISVMVNAPRVATYTYTRDDLIGQAEIRPLTPRRERKNTIIPRYKSEANGWQYVPAGEVTSSVYRDEDRGEPRSLEIEYTHVRDAKQAGQLAAYDLANLREGLTATLPSKVHLMHVHPGDCIKVDVPELALAGQKFIVRRATTNHQSASVTLELRSESDAKHAWALGQAAQPAPSPSLSAVDPKYVPPPAPEDWTVVPKPPGEGGVSQPIVVIELPIETTDIAAVIIKHGPTAAGPWTDGYEGSPRTDGRYEVAGLTPGQTYCVSLQYVAKNGAKSDPDIKCGIVAGDLIAGDTTHLSGEPTQDVLDRLTDTKTLADQTATEVQSIRDMYGSTADAATSAAKSAAHEAAANQAKADAILAAEASDQRAQAADEAKLEAQQARAGAVSARNDSVAAAGASGDAAAIAAEERQLAAEARNQAQAEAQAAVGARNQASSFADAAGVGAAASQEASLKATAAAITTIPDAIAADLWTDIGSSGAPADRPSLAPQRVVDGAFVAPTGGVLNAGPKQRVRWVQGKVIEIRLRAEVPAGTPAASARIGVTRFDANHVNLNSNSWMAITAVAAGGSKEVVYRIGCGVAVPGGSTINLAPGLEWLSIGCTPNLNAAGSAGEPGAQMRITAFSVRDITEEVNAARSADASASSAASAAASDGAAGQKAAAAHQDMLAAQTARGGAESAEIRAVEARDGAEGYAATSAAASNLSSQYRDQSQTAAQASNEAAGIATTKADQAGASAQAANAEKLAAQAARDAADQKAQASVTAAARAEAFAGDAGDWAEAAEGAALQAAASAGEGLAYRNAAVDARDEAVAARQGAGVSASTAQVAKVSTFPTRLDTDGSNFTTGANGSAETTSGLPVSRYENVPGFGLVGTASDGAVIYHRAPKAFSTGRVYRARVRVELVAAAAQNVRISVRATDGDYITVATNPASAWVSVTPGVVTEISRTYGNPTPSGGSSISDNTAWVRAGVQSQGAVPGGGKLRVYEIIHEDITESVSAANSAASALTQSAGASAAASEARLAANLAASVSSRSGNLLSTTDFPSTAGWSANVPLEINAGPAVYHPLGERVLTVRHATAQVDVYSSRASVEEVNGTRSAPIFWPTGRRSNSSSAGLTRPGRTSHRLRPLGRQPEAAVTRPWPITPACGARRRLQPGPSPPC